MALSGTSYTNFSSYYRLQLEWSANQDISNNSSFVKVNLFLVSLNSSSNIISSSTRTASITINGNTVNNTEAGILNLSGGQKKLIHSTQLTINHNSYGNASVNISASLPVNLTLAGRYAGTVTVSDSASLNSIASNSSLASSANLRAGERWGISINRSSTAYTHEVRMYLNGRGITTVHDVGASRTYTFTTAELTEIFSELEGSTSGEIRIEVRTYSGNTRIGGISTHYGTMTKPSTSIISDSPSSIYVGDDIPFDITRYYSGLTHTVQLVRGGVPFKTITGLTTGGTISTSDIANELNNEITDVYANFGLVIETFYNGVSVGGARTAYIRIAYSGGNPTFAGNFTYEDTRTTTNLVTGDDQAIVSNQSVLVVTLPSNEKAVAATGTEIIRYEANFAGLLKFADEQYGDLTFTFVYPRTNGPTTLSITAYDDRGNTVTRHKTIKGIPYEDPRVSMSVSRVNGFEDEILIDAAGTFSRLLVNGIYKNDITSIRYRYKQSSGSLYGSWNTLSYRQDGQIFSAPQKSLTLPNTIGYDFQVEVSDRIETVYVTDYVSPGKPLFFLDTNKNSVGVNKFPNYNDAFEVEGDARFDKDLYVDGDVDSKGDINSRGTVSADVRGEFPELIVKGSYSFYDTEFITSSLGLRLDAGGSGYFRFARDGTFDPPSKKTINNHNIAEVRDSGSSHDNYMLIQNVETNITVSGQSYTDVSFPESFSADPTWVIAQAIESNSSAYNVTAYNITRYGCRVYGAHIHDDTRSFSFKISVVACGRKI